MPEMPADGEMPEMGENGEMPQMPGNGEMQQEFSGEAEEAGETAEEETATVPAAVKLLLLGISAAGLLAGILIALKAKSASV